METFLTLLGIAISAYLGYVFRKRLAQIFIHRWRPAKHREFKPPASGSEVDMLRMYDKGGFTREEMAMMVERQKAKGGQTQKDPPPAWRDEDE